MTESLSSLPAMTPRRILVVDDNADIMDSLAMVLRMLGHEVNATTEGEEAIAILERWPADLAFVDLGMSGVTGYDVAERVRAHAWGENIVLIAMTGWGREEDRQRSLAAGFDHHAVKPVNLQNLRALIERAPVR